MIHAVVTHDCARKIQVSYQLPFAIKEDDLAFFPGVKLKINRFSQMIQTAKDHFVLTDESSILISGIIGEPKLDVTFWKDNLDDGRALIEYSLNDILAASGTTS